MFYRYCFGMLWGVLAKRGGYKFSNGLCWWVIIWVPELKTHVLPIRMGMGDTVVGDDMMMSWAASHLPVTVAYEG